jgi:hypothetical protein
VQRKARAHGAVSLLRGSSARFMKSMPPGPVIGTRTMASSAVVVVAS